MKSCLPRQPLLNTVINLLLTTGTLCLNTLKAEHQFPLLQDNIHPSQTWGPARQAGEPLAGALLRSGNSFNPRNTQVSGHLGLVLGQAGDK